MSRHPVLGTSCISLANTENGQIGVPPNRGQLLPLVLFKRIYKTQRVVYGFTVRRYSTLRVKQKGISAFVSMWLH